MNERKKLRKLRAEEKQAEVLIDVATSALLHSPDGRAFILWWLDITNYGHTPWTPNPLPTPSPSPPPTHAHPPPPRMTSVDPEGFLSLLKEKNDAEREPNREDGNLGDDEDH